MAADRFQLIVAVHLFLLRDGAILLSRRFETGYMDGFYSVVAGHLEGNEEVRTAMAREACEEAGIAIAPEDLHVAGVMHRRSTEERVDFFLTAAAWSGEIANREPHKCDHLAWFPLNALPENMVPYVQHALETYRGGEWFSSFGWGTMQHIPRGTKRHRC